MSLSHGRIVVARRAFQITAVASKFLVVGFAIIAVGLAGRAQAADAPQTIEAQKREFSISIDGTKRGTNTMQIRRLKDGTVWMRGESQIKINYLVYRYNYTSSGTEVWKDGRLLAMKNVADFNGTQYNVKARSNGKSIQLSVNGTMAQFAPDVWLSSYWQSPDQLAVGSDRSTSDPNSLAAQNAGNRFVSILDSDMGQKFNGTLARIGQETLAIAGEQKECTHFRVTGDKTIDLWYDATGRLVRQDSTERRHQVRFELTEISAE
jgi:Family of unknown function (DUF6134)